MRKQQDKIIPPPHTAIIDGQDNHYLSAFPGQDGMLDLFALQAFLPQGALSLWLTNYIKGDTDALRLTLNKQVSRQFLHLFLDNQNASQYQSTHILRLGYPIAVLRHQGTLVSAPLLLWPIQFVADPFEPEKWTIKPVGIPPILNPFISAFWNPVRSFLKEHSSNPPVHVHDLPAWVQGAPGELVQFVPFPTQFAASVPRILWSAVLGTFPDTHRVFSGTAFWKKYPRGSSIGALKTHLSHIPLHPEQQTSFRMRSKDRISLVVGGAGTGKSHFMAHTVINGLFHGQRILVITDRLVAGKRLQLTLDRLGLNGLAIYFRSPAEDGLFLDSLLRQFASRQQAPISFDRIGFQAALQACQSADDHFHQTVRVLRRPRFNGMHWTKLVGQYLSASKYNGRTLLHDQLDAQQFTWSMDAYHVLCAGLEKAQPIFDALGTLEHPLNAIQDHIFLDYSLEESHSYIENRLEQFLAASSVLQHSYILLLNRYAEALQQGYDAVFSRLQQGVHDIQVLLEKGVDAYGNNFLLTSNVSIRLYQGVSGKVKKLAKLRNQVRSAYLRLVVAVQLEDHFSYTFPKEVERKNMRTLQTVVETFNLYLKQWSLDTHDVVEQYKQQLSRQSSHPISPWQDEASRLTQKLQLLLQQLNDENILLSRPHCQALALVDQQQFLSELLQHLDHLQLSLRDFTSYYHWRRFWLQQPPAGRNVITSMIRVKADNWKGTFTSWYYDQVLRQAFEEQLPDQKFITKTYESDLTVFRNKLPLKIRFSQEVRRNETLQELRRRQRMRYQSLLGKGNSDEDFTEPFDKDTAQFISEMLPVFICPSTIAAKQFDISEGPVFDMVILEGGQYIDAQTGASLAELGRTCVIIGDDGFSMDDDKDDVLESGYKQNFPLTRLQHIRRVFPGHPIQYGQSDWFKPGLDLPSNISWQEVLGYYNEEEGHNEKEGQALIRYVLDLQGKWSHQPPSIGIIAGTKGQRDWLAEAFFVQRKQNAEVRDWFLQLERNGLSILSIDELEGMRFDMVLCSLAYGPSATSGTTPHIGRLNTPSGRRQLYEFFASATQYMVVFNSISAAVLSRFTDEPVSKGTFLLGIFAHLARATAAQNDKEKKKWIKKAKIFSSPLPQHIDTDFLFQVGQRLKPFLGPDRMVWNTYPGPDEWSLVIRPARQSRFTYWLLPDDLLANGPDSNPEWELKERKRLLEKGILTVPVWSLRWWRNENDEARRVASHLFNLDQEAYGTR